MIKDKAIIFDLDGTLIDSIHDLHFSINYMLECLNYSTIELSEFKQIIGSGAQSLVKSVLLRKNLNGSRISENTATIAMELFLNCYSKNLVKNTCLFENVLDALKYLKHKYILTVATNKKTVFAKKILNSLNVNDYFDVVVGYDVTNEYKPHPSMLLHILNFKRLSPGNCVVVGDSSLDIIAARAAGIKNIGVLYGYSNRENIINANPDYLLEKTDNLINLVKKALK